MVPSHYLNQYSITIGPLRANFSEILIEILNIFFDENALENVCYFVAAILSRSQCVNTHTYEAKENLSERYFLYIRPF